MVGIVLKRERQGIRLSAVAMTVSGAGRGWKPRMRVALAQA